jgi:nitrate/nitrite transporter NarK
MALGQFSAFLSDLIGGELTLTMATILSITAVIVLILVRDISQPWLLYVFAVCFGYGRGLCSATVFAGMADLVHSRHFGTMGGLILTGFGVGGAIGPWLGGHIYDISGSYTSAFLLCIGCVALSCITFWLAAPRKAKSIRTMFK